MNWLRRIILEWLFIGGIEPEAPISQERPAIPPIPEYEPCDCPVCAPEPAYLIDGQLVPPELARGLLEGVIRWNAQVKDTAPHRIAPNRSGWLS